MQRRGDRRKFWCDACSHWIEGTREDIKNHNGTALHRKATERKLKEKHADSRRQKVVAGAASGEEHLIPLEKTHGEKKKEEKKKKMMEAMKRVAEREAKKRDSDAALMAKSISLKAIGGPADQGKIWEVVVDEESGKACFMNVLSGEKKFEKPFGLKLSEEDQEFWDRCQTNVAHYYLGY